MKKIAIIFAVLVAAVACQKNDTDPIDRLEVNYSNISGSWKLDSFEGNKLAEGVFQYINFERKATPLLSRKFQEYTNLNWSYPDKIDGEYILSPTEEDDTIIEGLYPDKLKEPWNHKYIITVLTEDRMVWVAQDDFDIVLVYVRAEIPAELLERFPSDEE